jgi:hypothetical protein
VVQQTYQRRFSDRIVKKKIRSLIWKESLFVSNSLRAAEFDFAKAFATHPQMKFLMPIRNPIDCAISNCMTGHGQHFEDVKANTEFDKTLDNILKEIEWFVSLRKRYPQQFFCYYQDEFDAEALTKLATFLGIESDQRWLADALECYRLKQPYAYSKAIRDAFQAKVSERFRVWPIVKEKLLGFSEQNR